MKRIAIVIGAGVSTISGSTLRIVSEILSNLDVEVCSISVKKLNSETEYKAESLSIVDDYYDEANELTLLQEKLNNVIAETDHIYKKLATVDFLPLFEIRSIKPFVLANRKPHYDKKYTTKSKASQNQYRRRRPGRYWKG